MSTLTADAKEQMMDAERLGIISSYVEKVCLGLESSRLQTGLLEGVRRNQAAFSAIEACFAALIETPRDPEVYRHFFGTWRSTNNSAMCVSGLSNRLSMMAFRGRALADPSKLLPAIASLNRISDEDLGVGGGVLHSYLFARMATFVVGDDGWRLDSYQSEAGRAYSRWKNLRCLVHRDLMVGLLTTAVHEVYTHGEVEFMHPLFHGWMHGQGRGSASEIARHLAWITVHCGPTERDHFRHAVDAIGHYSEAAGVSIDAYDVAGFVDEYLGYKVRVMNSIREAIVALAGEPGVLPK